MSKPTTTIRAGTSNCELCGKNAELRPYGPGGKFICFACGMKDEPATLARMSEVMSGDVVLDVRDPSQPEPSIITKDETP